MPRHILITAGGSGLGRAMAEAFAACGCLVAITDNDPAMVEEMANARPEFLCFTADAACEDDMRGVFTTLQGVWQRLDVLMANAGIAGPTAAIEDISMADWQQCLAVNLNGAFLATALAAPWMKQNEPRDGGRGVMTLTSSTAGLFGYPLRAPYAAAKWGVIGLTKTLAMELGPFGIRVNAICPGAVEGERMDRVIANEAQARGISEAAVREGYADCTSLKRFVTAKDIANMAVFLASPEAASISGAALAVDGHTEKVTL